MSDYGPGSSHFAMEGDDFHCSTCAFLVGKQQCENEDFAKFMKKTSTPVRLPVIPEKYCCNAYRPREKAAAELHWVTSLS